METSILINCHWLTGLHFVMKKGKGWHKEWAHGMLQSSDSGHYCFARRDFVAETLTTQDSGLVLATNLTLRPLIGSILSSFLQSLDWAGWDCTFDASNFPLILMTGLRCLMRHLMSSSCLLTTALSPWFQCPHNTQFLHPRGHRLKGMFSAVLPENAQDRLEKKYVQ